MKQHACTHARTHTHTHTRTHAHAHTRMRTHPLTLSPTCMYARTHQQLDSSASSVLLHVEYVPRIVALTIELSLEPLKKTWANVCVCVCVCVVARGLQMGVVNSCRAELRAGVRICPKAMHTECWPHRSHRKTGVFSQPPTQHNDETAVLTIITATITIDAHQPVAPALWPCMHASASDVHCMGLQC
jgi:hypothetical protein